jgi:hypothetical protein
MKGYTMANDDTILHQADVEAVIDAKLAGKTIRTGLVTLVAGTVTVADTDITANSIIRLSSKTIGGTPGALFISEKTPGTNFDIKSTDVADTSIVKYEVLSD